MTVQMCKFGRAEGIDECSRDGGGWGSELSGEFL